MSNYTWKYIEEHRQEVKRLLGINYEQLKELIEQVKELIEQGKILQIKGGGGKGAELPVEEQIILTIIYLKHHLTFQLLGLLFQVSESRAHNLFNHWQGLFRGKPPTPLLEQIKNSLNNRESSINIDDQQKVAIVCSLMRDVRNHIDSWHKQVYTGSIWSVGIFLGAAGYWIVNFNSLLQQKVPFLIAILLFGLFIQSYLWFCINALNNNGKVLVKCEEALKLNKENHYFLEESFFKTSDDGNWLIPKDCITITILNLFILIFTLVMIAGF